MKKNTKQNTFFLLALLTSCSSTDTFNVTKLSEEPAFKAITYDSNLRSTYAVSKASKYKFCSEPSPDSSETKSDTVKTNVVGPHVSEGIKNQNGLSSTSLGGRNSTVLLAREILFRVCELGINYSSNYEQQAAMFTRALETIEKIADEAQAQGTETKAMTSSKMWQDVVPTADNSKNTSKKSSGDDSDDDSDDES